MAVCARSILVMGTPLGVNAYDIGDPAFDVFIGCAQAKDFVRFAVFIEVMQVYFAFFKTRFLHDFANFRYGPEAPVVGESASVSFDAWNVEMNIAGGVMVDGVIGGLIPNILKRWDVDAGVGCEFGNLSSFIVFDSNGFGSTIDIENKQPVFFESAANIFKVGKELFALLKNTEGKVEDTFSSLTKPMSQKITQKIEETLKIY